MDEINTNKKINNDEIMFKTKCEKYIKNQHVSSFTKCLYFIFPFLYLQDTMSKRAVLVHSPSNSFYGYSNRVINTKYNFLSFIPVVILNQFRFFGNQFYLLMTLSQFIPILKVGFLFSYLAPLLIVILMSLLKELIDEIKRYNQDKITNNEKFIKLEYDTFTKTLKKVNILSKDIKIGDILILHQNKRAPGDLIILNNKIGNNLYIRTDQLDGETDWKNRKVPLKLQNKDILSLFKDYEILIEYEPPNKKIYEFKGTLNILNKNNKEVEIDSLSSENTIWESTILETEETIGIVIYTGKDTRAKMNSTKPKLKIGLFDLEINFYNKLLFFIMFILAFAVVYFKDSNLYYKIICFMRFIVLFCGIIPISLRVNLDLSKGYFSYLINNDNKIKGTVVRNSNFPEDLGRVSYLFSDKTGTLTKNEMIFKCLNTEKESLDSIFDLEKIKNIIINKNNDIIYDCIKTMSLCNNVTPILDKKGNVNSYQASSPDEISLVEFAVKCGIKLIFRNDNEIKIEENGEILSYQILGNFPFSSNTKRMGIILKDNKTNKIIFYLKGAENIIVNFVLKNQINIINENAEILAKKGLRTLVLSKKEISEDLYNNWKIKYEEAKLSMSKREEKIQNVINQLEYEMNFLCVTGVEDLLQDNVKETIENLRKGGIKIWMLTGDKAETAKCISVSTGLKSDYQKIFSILYNFETGISIEKIIEKIKKKLNEFNKKAIEKPNENILLIEGKIIDFCLRKELKKLFFLTAIKSPCVICCRCSPTQKSQIVKKIKKYIKKNERTCSIGDGGNDVPMILKADIGIGIVGKEGLQASLSSDFSIQKFEILNILLLWYGRLTYKNSAKMSNFIIHRGLIISFIQCIFSCIFYYNAVALYNGFLILGYSTLYTIFPAMSLLLDYDINYNDIIKFPSLYRGLLKGRELSIKNFLGWTWKSIFQATIIMIGSIYLFTDNIFLKIVTITFSELIFAEVLNVYLVIKHFNFIIVCSLFGTCVIYLISLITLKNLLNIYSIFEFQTLKNIGIISFISWFPIEVFNFIVRIYSGNEIEQYRAHEILDEKEEVLLNNLNI